MAVAETVTDNMSYSPSLRLDKRHKLPGRGCHNNLHYNYCYKPEVWVVVKAAMKVAGRAVAKVATRAVATM